MLLFGVAGLFAKWVSVGALWLVFGRLVFAAPPLAAVLLLRGSGLGPRPSFAASGGRGGWALLACGALLVVHWLAFFHSIRVSTVAVGLLAFSTAPMFASLLEPWWFREPFSRRALAASLITLGGIVLMVPRWEAGDATLLGAAWGVLAGSSFAVLSLLNRGLRERHDSVTLAFYQDGAAAGMMLPLLPLFGPAPGGRDLLLLALLGVVFTALAHGLFIHALRTVRARMATLVSNLEPVYGIALAVLLLGELPAPRTLAGGALILAAVAWVTLRPEPATGEK